MKLALIISTYEQPAALRKALEGVRRQTRPPDGIFITDDGSGQETRRVIEDFRGQVGRLVHHLWQAHEGFRKTILLNQAVAAAASDYVVFTDGDCVPHGKFLADHERLAEPGFWVQGRRCFVQEQYVPDFDPDRTPIWRWMLAGRISGAPKGVRLPRPLILRNQKQRGIIGCNMAFWHADLLAVNGFDEAILGRGVGPDSDLGTRVYNLGRRRKFVYGRAIVYHLNHPILPRENLPAKRAQLEETRRSGKTRCERGLQQYLTAP